mmetsp:Transcript_25818/g.59555  ORF Transcript_25818/g.59555 Transcript_25818/m.59555 type:complete len:218 (-) Transcript_25818:369-1022(-)
MPPRSKSKLLMGACGTFMAFSTRPYAVINSTKLQFGDEANWGMVVSEVGTPATAKTLPLWFQHNRVISSWVGTMRGDGSVSPFMITTRVSDSARANDGAGNLRLSTGSSSPGHQRMSTMENVGSKGSSILVKNSPSALTTCTQFSPATAKSNFELSGLHSTCRSLMSNDFCQSGEESSFPQITCPFSYTMQTSVPSRFHARSFDMVPSVSCRIASYH